MFAPRFVVLSALLSVVLGEAGLGSVGFASELRDLKSGKKYQDSSGKSTKGGSSGKSAKGDPSGKSAKGDPSGKKGKSGGKKSGDDGASNFYEIAELLRGDTCQGSRFSFPLYCLVTGGTPVVPWTDPPAPPAPLRATMSCCEVSSFDFEGLYETCQLIEGRPTDCIGLDDADGGVGVFVRAEEDGTHYSFCCNTTFAEPVP